MINKVLTQAEIDAQWDPHIARQLKLNGPVVCALIRAAAEANDHFSEGELDELGKEAQ